MIVNEAAPYHGTVDTPDEDRLHPSDASDADSLDDVDCAIGSSSHDFSEAYEADADEDEDEDEDAIYNLHYPTTMVLDNPDIMRGIVEAGTQQTELDQEATQLTNTSVRYRRFQAEFIEYLDICQKVWVEVPLNVNVDVESVYVFLLFHAYRPAFEEAHPRLHSRRTYPKYFRKDDFDRVMALFDPRRTTADEREAIVRQNATQECRYIGDSHLTTMRSALVKHPFCSPEIRKGIRESHRIKSLLVLVKRRKNYIAGQGLGEKTPKNNPPFELISKLPLMEFAIWKKGADAKDLRSVCAALRDRWCFNDSLQSLVRAESLWKEDLSDSTFYVHSMDGEFSKYEVHLRHMREGKTNQLYTGHTNIAQLMRHKVAERSGIGAKAMYLFLRFCLTGEII